jgi:hypothetical protein
MQKQRRKRIQMKKRCITRGKRYGGKYEGADNH